MSYHVRCFMLLDQTRTVALENARASFVVVWKCSRIKIQCHWYHTIFDLYAERYFLQDVYLVCNKISLN
jgi:hypothetical protein